MSNTFDFGAEFYRTLRKQGSQDAAFQIAVDVVQHGRLPRDLRGFTQAELDAVYNFGHSAYIQHDFQKAGSVFHFLCMQDPLEARYWKAWGGALKASNQLKQALLAYSMLAVLEPDDPEVPLQASDCHLRLGDVARAKSGLEAAIFWAKDRPEYNDVRAHAQALLDKLNQGKSADIAPARMEEGLFSPDEAGADEAGADASGDASHRPSSHGGGLRAQPQVS